MRKLFLFCFAISLVAVSFAQSKRGNFHESRSAHFPVSTHKTQTDSVLEHSPDSLNYTLYTFNSPSWGFVTGTNSYGDQAWAERYKISGMAATIKRAISFNLGTLVNASDSVSYVVYDVNASKLPGNTLATKRSAVADMAWELLPGGSLSDVMNTVDFNPQVPLPDSFYISWAVPSYTPTTLNDTLALWVKRSPARYDSLNYGVCATKWDDNSWHDEYSENTGLLFVLGVFPLIDVQSTTSSDAYLENKTFKLYPVYPNPVSETLNLHFNQKIASETSIHIFDLNGRKVLNTSFGNLPAGESIQKVSVSGLNPGVYTYVIMTQEGGGIAGEFIVSK